MPRPRPFCAITIEEALWAQGYQCVAGVDEVGRGCLFGPVIAAAVILPPHIESEARLEGLRDSKQLSAVQRRQFAERIRSVALAFAFGEASVEEINLHNILQASRLAMRRAVEELHCQPDFLLTDACNTVLTLPQQAIIKGDEQVRCIGAASVLAKVYRDEMMAQYEDQFPGYGLVRNKGYGTQEHRTALQQLGPTMLHRCHYAPVREAALSWRQASA